MLIGFAVDVGAARASSDHPCRAYPLGRGTAAGVGGWNVDGPSTVFHLDFALRVVPRVEATRPPAARRQLESTVDVVGDVEAGDAVWACGSS